jgi:biofilm protein TabA
MITDLIANAATYKDLSPRIAAALEFLRHDDLASLATGRYTVAGDSVFAIISDYQTSPSDQAKWEAHRRFIDIHYLISGNERVGYSPAQRLSIAVPYQPEHDCLFLSGHGDWLTLSKGKFAIFYPQDAHCPGITLGQVAETVRKVVVKVEV